MTRGKSKHEKFFQMKVVGSLRALNSLTSRLLITRRDRLPPFGCQRQLSILLSTSGTCDGVVVTPKCPSRNLLQCITEMKGDEGDGENCGEVNEGERGNNLQ